MKSPEQMGGLPEQPKEEPMKDKEETSEKPAPREPYNEAEWEKLKQGDSILAIKKGKEMGVPKEELITVGEQAYKLFFDNGKFDPAMRIAADIYGMDSERWKRAAEGLTRQRRREYNLEESRELASEEAEEIKSSIKELLERLNEYDYNSLSPEVQDEWYWVEEEAEKGEDRELAKAVLEQFLVALSKIEE